MSVLSRRCPACGGRGWRLDLDEPCSCVNTRRDSDPSQPDDSGDNNRQGGESTFGPEASS